MRLCVASAHIELCATLSLLGIHDAGEIKTTSPDAVAGCLRGFGFRHKGCFTARKAPEQIVLTFNGADSLEGGCDHS